MAQTGYTPISLYYSTTPSAVPTAGNLVPGELAINIADMKMYCEDSSGVVTLLASSGGASGDVVGPASATDEAFVRFDGATGKLIQNTTGATLSDSGSPTFTSLITVAGTSAGAAEIRLSEDTDNGTNYIGLSAPATVGSNLTFVLPATDGTNGQALTTDGSGNLSFTTISAGASKGQAIAFALIFG